MKQYYQTASLNDIEFDYLMHIYRQRLKRFLPVFLTLLAIAGYFSFSIAGAVSKDGDIMYTLRQFCTAFLFTGGPVLLFGGAIYFKRIVAFRNDAKNGFKELIPYVIQEKEYFYRTNKFFFRIDDPENLHYEVDEETFVRYKEGDTVYISRAPLSRYTFEYGGRFTLI